MIDAPFFLTSFLINSVDGAHLQPTVWSVGTQTALKPTTVERGVLISAVLISKPPWERNSAWTFWGLSCSAINIRFYITACLYWADSAPRKNIECSVLTGAELSRDSGSCGFVSPLLVNEFLFLCIRPGSRIFPDWCCTYCCLQNVCCHTLLPPPPPPPVRPDTAAGDGSKHRDDDRTFVFLWGRASKFIVAHVCTWIFIYLNLCTCICWDVCTVEVLHLSRMLCSTTSCLCAKWTGTQGLILGLRSSPPAQSVSTPRGEVMLSGPMGQWGEGGRGSETGVYFSVLPGSPCPCATHLFAMQMCKWLVLCFGVEMKGRKLETSTLKMVKDEVRVRTDLLLEEKWSTQVIMCHGRAQRGFTRLKVFNILEVENTRTWLRCVWELLNDWLKLLCLNEGCWISHNKHFNWFVKLIRLK